MSQGPPSKEAVQAELAAVQVVVSALSELTVDAQDRVLDYTLRMLGRPAGRAASGGPALDEQVTLTPLPPDRTAGAVSVGPAIIDIRTLKEEKQPRTANEMAALVAYYLSELAPADDRRDSVSTEDLEKYFKQAQYPLPSALRMTLTAAKAAGYFDTIDRGHYRLNPVGYNLVVHGLPAGGDAPGGARRRATPRKSVAKKATARKASPAKTAATRTASPAKKATRKASPAKAAAPRKAASTKKK